MEIKTSYDGIDSLRIDGNGISLGPAVEETKSYGLNREPCTLTTTFTPQKVGINYGLTLSGLTCSIERYSVPKVEKIIFSKGHTIVIWDDKTKTIVNCSGEKFDAEKGLAMAFMRKMMSRTEFCKLLKKADNQMEGKENGKE